jgi:RNA polymerase primary sigma factor
MRQLKISNELKTQRSENIARYFNDVDRIDMLTPEQEWKIAIRAQAGDETAVAELVKANLRFVISVAKQYAPNAEKLEEMISQGNIGLVDAARTFDPTRGFKFISYAVWHIRKEIMYYLTHTNRTVRIPQNINTDIAKIRKMQDAIFQKEGRLPNAVELMDESIRLGYDFTPDRLKKVDAVMTQRAVPLENTDDPDAPSLIAGIQNEDAKSNFAETSDMEALSKVLFSRLTEKERMIVQMRSGLYDGEEWSFSQIGDHLGRTSEMARQTYKKALRKVKIQAIGIPGLRQQVEELV